MDVAEIYRDLADWMRKSGHEVRWLDGPLGPIPYFWSASIPADRISAGTIKADQIKAGEIRTDQIFTDQITIDRLAANEIVLGKRIIRGHE